MLKEDSAALFSNQRTAGRLQSRVQAQIAACRLGMLIVSICPNFVEPGKIAAILAKPLGLLVVKPSAVDEADAYLFAQTGIDQLAVDDTFRFGACR